LAQASRRAGNKGLPAIKIHARNLPHVVWPAAGYQ
jgi:hypothetical protein